MVNALVITAFVAIVLATWFLGLWNNVITFVNTVMAAMIASNFFEPLADLIDNESSTYTYLLDFVCLWLLFFLSFVVMRLITDVLSRNRVQFNLWLDRIVRTVFGAGTAWVFICFMLFSLHTAPMNPQTFQVTPDEELFAGAPDRLWLGFLQSRSRGALAAPMSGPLMPEYDLNTLHNEDKDLDCRVFDSKSDFIYKYHYRRVQLSNEEELRVNR